ncbi:hypothetical protein AC23_4779 [Escherichia coli 7-233-03_S3_C2]|nr:hypothetical protein AC23_4779 [Escherichia coli 7-233-03_S3_C2]
MSGKAMYLKVLILSCTHHMVEIIRISFMKMEILSWHQIRTIVWM